MQHISRKKTFFPLNPAFRRYLKLYEREIRLPIAYEELRYYDSTIPVYDKDGNDTLWESVFYPDSMYGPLKAGLKRIYSILKAGGDQAAEEHLQVERIDYCTFGNSHPFRIRIVNTYNEVYDYFYIKTADASRIYGLELEHILSPYWMSYIIDGNTLVEEHIAGVPGDQFIAQYLQRPEFNPKRIAKEFVKFNERCFVRLLGDMRSYNFVFDITPDFDDVQFRIRAIDFDQQFYEGKRTLYMPQFFKENKIFVDLAIKHLNAEVVKQYQQEERSLIARRIKAHRHRIKDLRDVIMTDKVSFPEKITQLGVELAQYYDDPVFARCKTMGEIIERSLKRLLVKSLK
ncbi:hypothetical protein [Chitinophaga sancti]|uniref:Uncharacterized protein n=1 Tax=Chitinophaga sancti TaxID=1004 RepID=A0A1K1SA96_9BACT|nr:hypothetical protein [Chitinophaga sancti]WQD60915.1 hypothetical protein U0033_23735 [Chitinophaga sancti]WQG86957.1 hypothetical protein SR876_18735 [Chitinophaga sancti]SFW81007.1 hypothetical protein SAMN05661012_05029 [Chitinophaga sancti]